MANYLTTDTELTSVASAIRSKGGTSAQLTYPSGFVSAIQAIPTGTTTYTITASVSNVTASPYNATIIAQNGTVVVGFTADGTSYKVPTTAPTVTGATATYTRTSDTECSITLTNPTGNISFTVTGEAISTGYTVTFSNITVSSRDSNSGLFYMTYDGTTPTSDHYNCYITAESYGNASWEDENGNALTIPFTRSNVSIIKVFSPGANGFGISLNGVEVITHNTGDWETLSANVTENCTLTGWCYRTD